MVKAVVILNKEADSIHSSSLDVS